MKFNKGISIVSLVIMIIVLLMTTGAGISLVMYSKDLKRENNENKTTQKIHENCKHDWVVTSKYDFLTSSYKTISKCSKCGKEVD